jgi:hypothetical protein
VGQNLLFASLSSFTEVDRIIAACNTVGDLFRLCGNPEVDHDPLLIQVNDLQKYCRAFSGLTDEDLSSDNKINFNTTRPEILHAFIQCLSPVPQGQLPSNLVTFQNYSVTPNVGDRFGTLDLETSNMVASVKHMAWNLDECMELHQLAVLTVCSLVKDMVTDRILVLYGEWMGADQKSVNFDPNALLKDPAYIEGLDKVEDRGFLNLWAEIVTKHGPQTTDNAWTQWRPYGMHALIIVQGIYSRLYEPE